MSSEEQLPTSDKSKRKIIRAAATAAVVTAAVATAVTTTGATAAVAGTEAQSSRPAFTVAQLDDMLASANLENADNVRVVKALEVDSGALFAVQYDR
jgi:hypothetical protein